MKINNMLANRYTPNFRSNITFDRGGRIYSYGDATQSLIRDMENS